MVASTDDLWVPPPPRRAVLRASAVTAVAMAATVLSYAASPALHVRKEPAAAQCVLDHPADRVPDGPGHVADPARRTGTLR